MVLYIFNNVYISGIVEVFLNVKWTLCKIHVSRIISIMFFVVILSRVEILFQIDILCTLMEFIFGIIYAHFMLRDGNCTNTYNNFVEEPYKYYLRWPYILAAILAVC